MRFETLTETEWEQIERVRLALDDGDPERAARELRRIERSRRDHPDVRVVAAELALEEGDARTALERLDGAERSADPAWFFHLRARARYESCRFEDARADATKSLAIQGGDPDVHDLLSRIADHLGAPEAAAEHAAEANELDPEGYPLPLEMDDRAFDALVERSLDELQPEVKKHLDEWPVIVDPLPTREMLTADAPPLSPDLLGLFVGQNLMDRSFEGPAALPGTIRLFRRNLLRMCRDREELALEIQTTVRHEVGHLLGLDEDDLEEWGLG